MDVSPQDVRHLVLMSRKRCIRPWGETGSYHSTHMYGGIARQWQRQSSSHDTVDMSAGPVRHRHKADQPSPYYSCCAMIKHNHSHDQTNTRLNNRPLAVRSLQSDTALTPPQALCRNFPASIRTTRSQAIAKIADRTASQQTLVITIVAK